MQNIESFFESLVSLIDGGIVVADKTGTISYVNQGMCNMLLYDNPEELIGKKIVDITAPEDLSETKKVLGKKVGDEINLQLEKAYLTKKGTKFYGLAKLGRHQIGGKEYLTAFINDFTEQKKARQLVEKHYQEIVELADDIIFKVDVNGNFVFVNDYTIRLCEFSEQELLSMNYIEMVLESHRAKVTEFFRDHFLSKKSKTELVFPIVSKFGKVIWLSQKLSTVWSDDGKKIESYSAVARDVTKEYVMREELKESEQRYMALFDNSTIPLWIEDFSHVKNRINELKLQGVTNFEDYLSAHPEEVMHCTQLVKILEVNKEAIKLHKAKSKQELLEGLHKIFTQESIDVFRKELIAIAQEEGKHEFESVVATLCGELRHIQLKWSPMPGYEHNLEKVFVSTTDITERVIAHQKLVENEQRLSTIFNTVEIPIVVSSPATCEIIEVNNATLKMVGYTEKEMKSILVSEIDGRHSFEYVKEALNRSMTESVVRGQTLWKSKSGELFDVNLTNRLIRYNGEDCVLTSGVDVTELKKLNRENERFRIVMDDAPFAIYITNRKGKLLDVNTTATIQLGYTREEFLKLSIKDIQVAGTPIKSEEYNYSIEKVIDDELNIELELKHKRKNGSVFPVHVTISGRKIDNQDYIIASVFDNTIVDNQRRDLLNTQRELFESNESLLNEIELRKKTQMNLVSSEERERKRISRELHDGLGQKLTAVKYSLGALKRRQNMAIQEEKILQDSINVIEESMREVREISHNLMPSLLADFGLEVALAKICKRIDSYHQLSVDYSSVGEIPQLNQNTEVTLYRVAQEAINNAVKHSEASQIKVQLVKDYEGLELIITDNGKGFKSGQNEKNDGIGLKNIEERCSMIKAECNINSKLGKGTEIVVKCKLIVDAKN